jgi:hypothetical protein
MHNFFYKSLQEKTFKRNRQTHKDLFIEPAIIKVTRTIINKQTKLIRQQKTKHTYTKEKTEIYVQNKLKY